MAFVDKADFLATYYSPRTAQNAAANYGAVEDTLAAMLGEPIAVMVSTYEQDAYFQPESDNKLRFVSHFRNTTYEFGIISTPELTFDVLGKSVDLTMHDDGAPIRLTDLTKSRTSTRRDIGRSLTVGSFPRELMAVQDSLLLLPRMQLFAGMNAIKAFLERPEYGSVPSTQALFAQNLSTLGVNL
jgi:hypothetical protein